LYLNELFNFWGALAATIQVVNIGWDLCAIQPIEPIGNGFRAKMLAFPSGIYLVAERIALAMTEPKDGCGQIPIATANSSSFANTVRFTTFNFIKQFCRRKFY